MEEASRSATTSSIWSLIQTNMNSRGRFWGTRGFQYRSPGLGNEISDRLTAILFLDSNSGNSAGSVGGSAPVGPIASPFPAEGECQGDNTVTAAQVSTSR